MADFISLLDFFFSVWNDQPCMDFFGLKLGWREWNSNAPSPILAWLQHSQADGFLCGAWNFVRAVTGRCRSLTPRIRDWLEGTSGSVWSNPCLSRATWIEHSSLHHIPAAFGGLHGGHSIASGQPVSVLHHLPRERSVSWYSGQPLLFCCVPIALCSVSCEVYIGRNGMKILSICKWEPWFHFLCVWISAWNKTTPKSISWDSLLHVEPFGDIWIAEDSLLSLL